MSDSTQSNYPEAKSLLKVVHLHSGYRELRVIDGLSMHVNPGEVVALVGANGAGKSTLLKTLAGLLTPNEGRILYKGQEIASWPAERRAGAGLVMVPEGRGLFSGMTVEENLRMGAYTLRGSAALLKRRLESVCHDFPLLNERLSEPAGHLSGGQQQMLALARALMSEPQLLLLDEPSTGLAPIMVAEVFQVIQRLKEGGATVILAEQNVREALRVADRAYVLKTGKVVLSGAAAELRESEDIKKAYLGM